MKKLISSLIIIFIFLSFCTAVEAQKYNTQTEGKSTAGITFVDDINYPQKKDNQKISNMITLLPKTNEILNPINILLGSILLIICYFIFRKNYKRRN